MTPSASLSLRVQEIAALTPTLKRLTLESADRKALPTAPPGAHLSLTLKTSERVLRNSYSITGPYESHLSYSIIVRRTAVSRGGSDFIHDLLKTGDVIEASAPSTQFPLHSIARKHLLISGGIGITPLLSFLPALRARNQRLEVHQFARAGETELFVDLLSPFADDHVHVHAGRHGTDVKAILARQPLGTHLYVCGPPMLMDAVLADALALGWPATNLHSERFGAVPGQPFTVRLARTGIDIEVNEHQTMLEALEAAGLPMRSLCRGGACGECLTPVVDGIPDHHDHYLSDEEKASGKLIMPCVSRAAQPRLVVDL